MAETKRHEYQIGKNPLGGGWVMTDSENGHCVVYPSIDLALNAARTSALASKPSTLIIENGNQRSIEQYG